MQRKALEHAGRMAEVGKKMDAARAALVQAAKQRKILEKLRERRESDWQDDQDRREQSVADEVAQQIGVRLVRAAGEGSKRSSRSSDSRLEETTDKERSDAGV